MSRHQTTSPITENATGHADDISQVLDLEFQSAGRRRWKLFIITITLLVVLAGSIVAYRASSNGAGTQFKTIQARQGNLIVTVTATGALRPVNQVDVGSELSGTIEKVEVDYNNQVERGQVLAQLNTDRLKAQVIQARASLASAKAKLREAKATVLETRLRFERCQKLAQRQLCSQDELDTNQAAYTRGQATEASAQAQVAVAHATLDTQETDLAKAVIRSPINGIVLVRAVEPGQTVAASFQTPVLFTLAENLAQMELHVDVDEADVGQVKEGQEATFTVDAYPNRGFPAQITQIRYGAQEIDGVITYETLLSVDNSDLALRPGMTATADIIVEKVENALLIPNKALRFAPPVQDKQPASSRGLIGYLFPRPSRSSSHKQRQEIDSSQKQQRVWILQNGQPTAIPITLGATDGIMTQVLKGEIEPGMALIVEAISGV
jgi:HlyD family secretion protein